MSRAQLEAVKSIAAAFGLVQTSVGRAFLAEGAAEERDAVERRRAQDCGFCSDHEHGMPCQFCAAEEG